MRLNKYFVFGLAILLISCNFKKADFSVRTPHGWVTIDTIKNGRRHLMMRIPINDTVPRFVENINISIVHADNLDEYISALTSEIKNISGTFKDEGKGIFEAKNFNAKWIQYTFKPKESADYFQQKVYFIADNRNVFMIACSSTPNGIKGLQKIIDDVIKSFKVIYN